MRRLCSFYDESSVGIPEVLDSLATTLVIPTWRRAPWLDRCLAAVAVQERPLDELIVVGRAEDGPARAVADRWAGKMPFRLRWIEVDRPGHIPPVRCGLDAAGGEIVAFLDDDAEPEPAWLDALLSPFVDPGVACVGGRVITPGFRGKVRRDAGRISWYGQHSGNVGALEAPGAVDVDGVMEGNWAWRAGVLRALALDPVFQLDDASMYGLDLCLQAKAQGYRILYQPRARVIHHAAPRDPSLDRGDRARRMRAYSRNYTYLALKHFRGLRRAAFWVWWWLVGERGSYGVAAAAVDLIMRRNGVKPLVTASFAGKRDGVRARRGR